MKGKIMNKYTAWIGFVILAVLGYFAFTEPAITGLFAGREIKQIDNVNYFIDESASFNISLGHTPTSFRLSGSLIGDGIVIVYLNDIIVLDNEILKEKGIASITGFVVYENETLNQTYVEPASYAIENGSDYNTTLNQTNVEPSATAIENVYGNITEDITDNITINQSQIAENIREEENKTVEENITSAENTNLKNITTIIFEDVCKDSCALFTNKTEFSLRIEVENAALNLTQIIYTYKEAEETVTANNEPEWIKWIPDIVIQKNNRTTIDLSGYFFDLDFDKLAYDVKGSLFVVPLINESIVTLIPDRDFVGVEYIKFGANDSIDITYSNEVMISVVENVTEIMAGNISVNATGNVTVNITTNQSQLEANKTFEESVTTKVKGVVRINSPVRWVKKVKLNEAAANITIELPEEAYNLSIVKIEENETIEIDKAKIKVKHQNMTKTLDEFETYKKIGSLGEGLEKAEEKEFEKEVKERGNLITGAVIGISAYDDEQSNVEPTANVEPSSYAIENISDNTNESIADDIIINQPQSESDLGQGGNITKENITELIIEENITEVEVEYETPGPEATEESISFDRKQIVVSSEMHYENILAYTIIEDASLESIKLYWLTNNSKQEVEFDAYDTNEDSLVDYIEWVVPSLSNQTYEVELNIINLQSYPTVGDNWTVSFNTTGAANLTITALGTTTYTEKEIDNRTTTNDIDMLELRCGGSTVGYDYIDNNGQVIPVNSTLNVSAIIKSLFVEDYSCNETSSWTVKVMTPGTHIQEFVFGNKTGYAKNFAIYQDGINISIGDIAFGTAELYQNELNISVLVTDEPSGNLTSGEIELTIGYFVVADILVEQAAPVTFGLTSPANNTISINQTPTLVWEPTTDTDFANYTVQVDTVSTLASPDYQYAVTSGTTNTTYAMPNILLANQQYYWRVIAFDQKGNRQTSNNLFYYKTNNTAPNITLISPANNSGDNDGNITFYYNVSDEDSILNCSLIISSGINQTSTSITRDTILSFALNNLAARPYNWSINCSDYFNNLGSSRTRIVAVTPTTEFSGDSTNFSAITDMSNITNLILKDSNYYGKINFSETVDLSSGSDIDDYISISSNRIEINSTALPELNKSAVLQLTNLTYTSPIILMDGSVCPSTVCYELSYAGGILTFNVTHFTAYSAEETPVEAAEEAGGGGGGGGGGVASAKEKISVNVESITEFINVNQVVWRELTITNEESKDTIVKIDVSDSLKGIIIMPGKIQMGKKESAPINYLIKGVKPGMHKGTITISTITTPAIRTIPVVIYVVEEKEKLLDLRVLPLNTTVRAGEDVYIEVEIRNLGQVDKVDVQLNLQLASKDTNETVVEQEEAIAVAEVYKDTKIIKTFRTLTPGVYSIRATAYYTELNITGKAYSSADVLVEKAPEEEKARFVFITKTWLFYYIFALLLLVIIYEATYIFELKYAIKSGLKEEAGKFAASRTRSLSIELAETIAYPLSATYNGLKELYYATGGAVRIACSTTKDACVYSVRVVISAASLSYSYAEYTGRYAIRNTEYLARYITVAIAQFLSIVHEKLKELCYAIGKAVRIVCSTTKDACVYSVRIVISAASLLYSSVMYASKYAVRYTEHLARHTAEKTAKWLSDLYYRIEPTLEIIIYKVRVVNVNLTKAVTQAILTVYLVIELPVRELFALAGNLIDKVKLAYISRKTVNDIIIFKARQLIKEEELGRALELIRYSYKYTQYMEHTYKYLKSYDLAKLAEHIKMAQKQEESIKKLLIKYERSGVSKDRQR